LSIAQSLLRRSTALRVTRGYHAPMREMKFLLYEVHDFPQHYADIAAGHGDVDESAAHQPCDKDTVAQRWSCSGGTDGAEYGSKT